MEQAFKSRKRDFEVTVLEDLPEEIILKIFSQLALKDLFNCMVLSKRIRNIAHDDSLWEKLNLVHNYKPMPATLFPQILAKGCKYLSVNSCCPYSTGESLSFENNYKLKYLSVIRPSKELLINVLPDLMASSFSLEKLSVRPNPFEIKPIMFGNRNIYSKFFKCIIQNSKTLRVLDLAGVNLSLESVKHIFTLCQELTELNLNVLDDKSMDFLCKNLTSKIEKIDIGSNLRVDQLTVLLRRCNKISELSINCTCLSDDSVSTIVENLSQSLVKLEIDMDEFSFSKILELAAMPKLQVLCDPDGVSELENFSDEEKDRFPAHLKTHHTDKLNIAVPYPNTYLEIVHEKKKLGYDYPGDYDDSIFKHDKFWEIEARPRVYQVNSYDYLEKVQKEEEEKVQLKLSKSRFPKKAKKE